MIGCKYFETPRQTEPNRSPPSSSESVTHSFSVLLDNITLSGLMIERLPRWLDKHNIRSLGRRSWMLQQEVNVL